MLQNKARLNGDKLLFCPHKGYAPLCAHAPVMLVVLIVSDYYGELVCSTRLTSSKKTIDGARSLAILKSVRKFFPLSP